MKNVEWCYLTSKRCGVKGFVQIGAAGGMSVAFPLACGRELIYSRTRARVSERRKKRGDMNSITASQLKTEGIAAIEKRLAGDCEAIITVRGEEKFVVMDMQRYNYQKCAR